jgi:hypothetical protein
MTVARLENAHPCFYAAQRMLSSANVLDDIQRYALVARCSTIQQHTFKGAVTAAGSNGIDGDATKASK